MQKIQSNMFPNIMLNKTKKSIIKYKKITSSLLFSKILIKQLETNLKSLQKKKVDFLEQLTSFLFFKIESGIFYT